MTIEAKLIEQKKTLNQAGWIVARAVMMPDNPLNCKIGDEMESHRK